MKQQNPGDVYIAFLGGSEELSSNEDDTEIEVEDDTEEEEENSNE